MSLEDDKAKMRSFHQELQVLLQRYPGISYACSAGHRWELAGADVELNGDGVMIWFDGLEWNYEELL